MNAVKEDVISLVHKELESANKKFPLFHSAHEGYAVIKEKLEEVRQQLDECNMHLNAIWYSAKKNRSNITSAQALKEYAIDLATEAIQVSAMAQKFIDSIEVPVVENSEEVLEGEKSDRREIVD